MDPTTAVRTDTLAVVATVVAPGAFASASYAWLVLAGNQGIQSFLDRHEGLALAAAILLWTVAGYSVESVGSYVEVYCIDRRKSDHKEVLAQWWEYLSINWVREPVGQRYLRRLLVSFKFELNMFVAAVVTIPGVAMLASRGLTSCSTAAGVLAALVVGAAVLFMFAWHSAEVLSDVRKRLVAAAKIDARPDVRPPG